MTKLQIGLVCGGPSLERGISLNSARSVFDHLDGRLLDGVTIEVVPFYLDLKRKAYAISKSQLYCNTPSDFDFKLASLSKPLSTERFVKALRRLDLVMPVMHGRYGEDGGFQAFLEKYRIPYVGSSAEACRLIADKYDANESINTAGFFTLPSVVVGIYKRDHKKIISDFFRKHAIRRAIVKPARGGSSIGVFSVSSVDEAVEKAKHIFSRRMDTRVVIEPFAEGKEFTVIILQNRYKLPVAVMPTEIEADYTQNQIFDFRKKYLPTRQVAYHCPPRFPDEVVQRIQLQAEQLFSHFGMSDFGRFDGWVLDSGEIWFSDFNAISGMEQNSFLFQQSAQLGMSHSDVLLSIVRQACRKNAIELVASTEGRSRAIAPKRKPLAVLFGGATSERQVSLMSGTNVWLKLRGSWLYDPQPFLLDMDNQHIWQLPYALTLNHTVEEIIYNCQKSPADRERIERLASLVRMKLFLPDSYYSAPYFLPKRLALEDFLKSHKFIFLGLHGGVGEDGTFQGRLSQLGVAYNGSDSITSRLCMNKANTAAKVAEAKLKNVHTIPNKLVKLEDLVRLPFEKLKYFWTRTCGELGSSSLIVKPPSDGCSSGIVRLSSVSDLQRYLELIVTKATFIPPGTFEGQDVIVDMPLKRSEELYFERFIEADLVRIKGHAIKYYRRSGLIEVTVGVLEDKGQLRVLSPSLTVVSGQVLSVEEKFQGGTGVNITPPPKTIVSARAVQKAREAIGQIAECVGINGYARIDAFMNTKSGEITLIEVNTLPGLTASTVFYHQALAEQPAIYPRVVLEKIVGAGLARRG